MRELEKVLLWYNNTYSWNKEIDFDSKNRNSK